MKADPELTQVLELGDKDIKTVIFTAFPMFKKSTRDLEDRTQTSGNGDYNV